MMEQNSVKLSNTKRQLETGPKKATWEENKAFFFSCTRIRNKLKVIQWHLLCSPGSLLPCSHLEFTVSYGPETPNVSLPFTTFLRSERISISQTEKSRWKKIKHFLGGPGVKNLPANAGGTDWIPGQGRFHNWAHATQLLSPRTYSLGSATRGPATRESPHAAKDTT